MQNDPWRYGCHVVPKQEASFLINNQEITPIVMVFIPKTKIALEKPLEFFCFGNKNGNKILND